MTDKPSIDEAMDELAGLRPDAELAERRGEADWLPVWFLQKLAELKGAEAAIKEHAATLLKQVEARRKAIWWKWGDGFTHQVLADIEAQGGKKKFLTYATGKAGVRKSGGLDTIVIDDEERAVIHALSICSRAVKTSLLKSELLKYTLKTGEELDGTHLEKTPVVDNFYPKRPQVALEADERPALEADDG